MPTYSITDPSGVTHSIDGPPGATQEQVIAQVQAHLSAAPKAAPQRGMLEKLGQGTVALERAIPFASEATAAIDAGLHVGRDLLTGRSHLDPSDPRGSLSRVNGQAFAASRARQNAMVGELHDNNPMAVAAATGTGYAAQVIFAMLSGGSTLAPEIEALVAPGLKSALSRFAKRTALAVPKNATIGAAYGVVNGAAQPGDLDARIQAAADGIVPGAAAGVALPAGVDAASAVARRFAAPATRGLSLPAERVGAAVKALAGEAPAPTAARQAITRPEVRAAQAIKNAMDRDAAAGHVADPTKPLRHAGGENVAALYDVVAQSPGPGRQIMRDAIDAHHAATSAAIRDDIGASLGGKGDYFATQEALGKTRAANAKPDLDAAFGEQIPTHLFDQHIGPLMGRLPNGALAAAKNLARMDGEADVERGLAMLDSFNGHSAETGAGAPVKVGVRDLKSVASGARPGLGQGPSLLSFIAKSGGLHDNGGELAALDLGSWHKAGAFRPKIIRPDGLSLDAMAEKAQAAGYFPNAKVGGMSAETSDSYHAVGGDDLHAAIQNELSGRPTYAREPDFAATDKTNHLDNLDERIRRAGLTAQGATPQDMGAALGAHDFDAARLEAHADGPNVGMSPNEQVDTYTPTLKVLHYLKKGIDQTLEPYRNDVTRQLDLSGSPDAQAQGRVRTLLGQGMRKVSPSYERAMQTWGDDSDGINALKLGRNVFSPKFDMQSEQLTRLHADMSHEAKAQFQKGVGEAIIAEVRKSGDIRSIRRLLGDNADEFRSRVALAFGDDPTAFGQFIERMGSRSKDAARDTRLMGGSPTYGRQAARADLEEAGTHPLDVLGDIGSLNAPALAGKALKGAIKMLPRGAPRSAIMDARANAALGRSSNDPDEVTRLLNMLQMSRRISAAPAAQRYLAKGIGAAGAAQGSNRPAT